VRPTVKVREGAGERWSAVPDSASVCGCVGVRVRIRMKEQRGRRGHLRRGVWRLAEAGSISRSQVAHALGALQDAAASASGHWLCHKSHMGPASQCARIHCILSTHRAAVRCAAASSVAGRPSATGICGQRCMPAGDNTGEGASTSRASQSSVYFQPSLSRRVATPAACASVVTVSAGEDAVTCTTVAQTLSRPTQQ
jgi:hypothetical protein